MIWLRVTEVISVAVVSDALGALEYVMGSVNAGPALLGGAADVLLPPPPPPPQPASSNAKAVKVAMCLQCAVKADDRLRIEARRMAEMSILMLDEPSLRRRIGQSTLQRV